MSERRAYLFTDAEIVLIMDALEAYKQPPEQEFVKEAVEATLRSRVLGRGERPRTTIEIPQMRSDG